MILKKRILQLSFLLALVSSSLIVSAQVRVIDNKGTIRNVDESKWTRIGITNDIYNKYPGNVGIGTSTPLATLHNAGSTLFGTLSLSDFAVNAAIGTAAATVDAYTSINLQQTTAGVTLSVPPPSNTTPGRIIKINNSGTTPFTIGTALLEVAQTVELVWNGTAWSLQTGGLGWSLTGNGGALAGTNFLGTITDVPMNIASNNTTMLQVGRRQTLGLYDSGSTGLFPYNQANNAVAYLAGGTSGMSALQFQANAASFYKPIIFTDPSGNFMMRGSAAATDFFELGSAGTANNGQLVFTIGDDGDEPMIFRKYNYTTQSYIEMMRLQGTGLNDEVRVGINTGGAAPTSTLQIDDVTTTGAVQTINATGVYTGTGLWNLNANSATTGTVANISLNGLTSGTGLNITSSSVSNTSTNGLLRVANTTATTTGTVFRAQSNSTAGSGLTVLASGNTGLGTSTPAATLHNAGSTLFGTLTLANFTANGAIGTAAATVDAYTSINIPQTTAGITLTLPAPANTTAGRVLQVSNTGTSPVTVGATSIGTAQTARFVYNGTVWTNPTGGGSVTSVSTAAANNGVTATWTTNTTTPALTIGLGAITPTSVSGLTLLSLGSGFSIAGGTSSKTLTVNNTLGLSGTDGSALNIGTGGTLGTNAYTSTAYAPLASPTFTGTVTNNGTFAGTAILGIANGGTGSSAQNWVDLTTAQSVAGAKTWNGLGTFNAGLTATGGAINLNASTAYTTNIGNGTNNLILLGTTDINQTGSANTRIGNTAGTLTLEGGTAATAIQIGNGATAHGIQIGTGAAVNTLVLGSTNSTSTTTIQGGSGTGAITMTPQTTGSIVIGAMAGTGAITLGNSSVAQTVNVGNGAGASIVNIANGLVGNTVSIANGANTTAQTINIGAGANAANNTINIGSGTNTAGVTAVTIGTNTNLANTTLIEGGNGASAITLTPQTTGSIVIGATAGTGAITLGNSSAAQTVNIGIGSGASTVLLGNTTTYAKTGINVTSPTAQLHLAAGTVNANTAPLRIDDGAVLGTIAKGAIEKDANVFYATPDAVSRGLLPAVSYSVLSADYPLGAFVANTAKNLFPTGQATVSVAANTTYEFEAVYYINTSATNHITSFLFANTATISSIRYRAQLSSGTALAVNTTNSTSDVAVATVVALNTTTTNGYMVITLNGIVRIGATGGTLTPQIRSSANLASGTCYANSFFKLTPIGTNTVTEIGSWN